MLGPAIDAESGEQVFAELEPDRTRPHSPIRRAARAGRRPLNSANAALTVIEYRPGLPPGITMFNDMSHLPVELRWTGFPTCPGPELSGRP